jgi:hypothetical protein
MALHVEKRKLCQGIRIKYSLIFFSTVNDFRLYSLAMQQSIVREKNLCSVDLFKKLYIYIYTYTANIKMSTEQSYSIMLRKTYFILD